MNSDTQLRSKANCSPYGPETLDRFRALLADQRRRALGDFEGISESALRTPGGSFGELSSLPGHLGELASDTQEQSMSVDFLARAQGEIAEVDDALERIEVRCYGVCEVCGQAIPESRLEAIPTARLCVPCKSQQES
jgi:RNA polymerase-binding transcription factor DksA